MDKTIRILLIEDNPGDTLLIEDMLREAHVWFELECSHKLSSGIAKVQSDTFHIILLDLGLPDSQGLGTLTRLNEIRPEAPIIVLTGLADEAVGIQAVQEGAQDYLIKGQTNGSLLVKAMRYAIERKQLENEKERLIRELQESLAKVKILSGLLPICASCRKIRDDKGYWKQVETYLVENSGARFTHGICPDCAKKLYPEYYDNIWGKEDK